MSVFLHCRQRAPILASSKQLRALKTSIESRRYVACPALPAPYHPPIRPLSSSLLPPPPPRFPFAPPPPLPPLPCSSPAPSSRPALTPHSALPFPSPLTQPCPPPHPALPSPSPLSPPPPPPSERCPPPSPPRLPLPHPTLPYPFWVSEIISIRVCLVWSASNIHNRRRVSLASNSSSFRAMEMKPRMATRWRR